MPSARLAEGSEHEQGPGQNGMGKASRVRPALTCCGSQDGHAGMEGQGESHDVTYRCAMRAFGMEARWRREGKEVRARWTAAFCAEQSAGCGERTAKARLGGRPARSIAAASADRAMRATDRRQVSRRPRAPAGRTCGDDRGPRARGHAPRRARPLRQGRRRGADGPASGWPR